MNRGALKCSVFSILLASVITLSFSKSLSPSWPDGCWQSPKTMTHELLSVAFPTASWDTPTQLHPGIFPDTSSTAPQLEQVLAELLLSTLYPEQSLTEPQHVAHVLSAAVFGEPQHLVMTSVLPPSIWAAYHVLTGVTPALHPSFPL